MKSNQIRTWLMATGAAAIAMAVVGSSPVRAEDKVLLRSLSKNGIGKAAGGKATTWQVKVDNKTLTMASFIVEGSVDVTSSGDDVDEMPGLMNGSMKIRLEAVARAGDVRFGVHHGSFKWADGALKAEGSMDGTMGFNSMRKPAFPDGADGARRPDKVEGVLSGIITGGPDALKGLMIRASYSGRWIPETATDGPKLAISIDGVWVGRAKTK